MAIYHFTSGFVSRSSGRSAVQNAAYISGEKLYEERREKLIDYRNRNHDVFAVKTLSQNSEFRSLEVWNKFENFEDKYADILYPNKIEAREKYISSAQTAQTIIAALPKELSLHSNQELVEEFANQRFVERGLVVTYAIHDDEGNPHAHFLISRRTVDEKGELSRAKDREICSKKELLESRKLWANVVNEQLERNGFKDRVSEKSFVDLGLNIAPSKHLGWYANQTDSRIERHNKTVFADNKEKIILNAEILLNELTSKSATFSEFQLLNLAQKRLGDDTKIVASVFEQALKNAVVLGPGYASEMRYTSRQYLESEAKANNELECINVRGFTKVDPIFETKLSDAQKEAVVNLTNSDALAVLIGRAGAGKTTALKSVVYSYAGFRVIGTSLSAQAAENLGNETEIESRTLHSWQGLWSAGKELMNNKTVMIVDEAGMVGTRQWGELLRQANATGAKVIAVGDDHQFKAVDAGDFFREIVTTSHNVSKLESIMRQQVAWQREASEKLAEFKVHEALTAYKDNVKGVESYEINTKVADAFMQNRNALVLAFSNKECENINIAIRHRLKLSGELKEDVAYINGKHFALGDKVVFLKNDKDNVEMPKGHFIKNGTLGVIENVRQDGKIDVKISDELRATFDPQRYKEINHGYALTIHKSQGKTVDYTILALSKNIDAKGLYVAATRHREDIEIFYDKNVSLINSLSRFESKDLAKDYTIRTENLETWQRIQDYKLCVLDAAAAAHSNDWHSYKAIKKDQVQIAKTILENYTSHSLFLKQAGFTHEMLEITAGRKPKTLSLAQTKAKLTVEQYANTAMLARADQTYRDDRNELAKEISKNYALHKPFISEFSKEFGINKKTITAQAKTVDTTVKYVAKTNTKSSEEIVQELNASIKDLALQILGNPERSGVREWRYGNKGSIAIHVAGHRQGMYANFETGVVGNAVTMISEQLNMDRKHAFKWGVEWLGHDHKTYDRVVVQKVNDSKWSPIFPAPNVQPNIKTDPYLAYMLKGREIKGEYAYKDREGNLLGYVVRLEDKNGQKITPTLTYCVNDNGFAAWRWQGFGDNRALYNLPELTKKPHATVLLVEGEKTADAAKVLFPDYAVLTWSGGAASLHKTDFSPLEGKDIIIWPDHDKAGLNAAHKLASILPNAKSINIVNLPETLPHKWDLADAVPENIDIKKLLPSNDKVYDLVQKVYGDNPQNQARAELINEFIKDGRELRSEVILLAANNVLNGGDKEYALRKAANIFESQGARRIDHLNDGVEKLAHENHIASLSGKNMLEAKHNWIKIQIQREAFEQKYEAFKECFRAAAVRSGESKSEVQIFQQADTAMRYLEKYVSYPIKFNERAELTIIAAEIGLKEMTFITADKLQEQASVAWHTKTHEQCLSDAKLISDMKNIIDDLRVEVAQSKELIHRQEWQLKQDVKECLQEFGVQDDLEKRADLMLPCLELNKPETATKIAFAEDLESLDLEELESRACNTKEGKLLNKINDLIAQKQEEIRFIEMFEKQREVQRGLYI